jgi:hypothetical protein
LGETSPVLDNWLFFERQCLRSSRTLKNAASSQNIEFCFVLRRDRGNNLTKQACVLGRLMDRLVNAAILAPLFLGRSFSSDFVTFG